MTIRYNFVNDSNTKFILDGSSDSGGKFTNIEGDVYQWYTAELLDSYIWTYSLYGLLVQLKRPHRDQLYVNNDDITCLLTIHKHRSHDTCNNVLFSYCMHVKLLLSHFQKMKAEVNTNGQINKIPNVPDFNSQKIAFDGHFTFTVHIPIYFTNGLLIQSVSVNNFAYKRNIRTVLTKSQEIESGSLDIKIAFVSRKVYR